MFIVQVKYPLRRKLYLVYLLVSRPVFSHNLEDARPYSRRGKADIAKAVLITEFLIPKNAVKVIPLHEAQIEQSKRRKHVLVRAVDSCRNILGI
jgi:hypothetical protein